LLINRAGWDAEWWMPEPGEQVLILSLSGKTEHGIIIGSLYQQSTLILNSEDGKSRKYLPKEDQQHINKKLYQDGSTISYDRKCHKFEISLKKEYEKEISLSFTAP
jgi:phage baseplate assembly protein V